MSKQLSLLSKLLQQISKKVEAWVKVHHARDRNRGISPVLVPKPGVAEESHDEADDDWVEITLSMGLVKSMTLTDSHDCGERLEDAAAALDFEMM